MPGWSWPNGLKTVPRVTSEFNPTRLNPVTHIVTAHLGIDLVGFGNNLAAADGVVTFCQYNGGAGNEIRVKHADGSETRYKHNARFIVRDIGAKVFRGQALGVMGTTGNSTGVHCHFETRSSPTAAAVNPRSFMSGKIGGSTSPAGETGTPLDSTSGDDFLSDAQYTELKKGIDEVTRLIGLQNGWGREATDAERLAAAVPKNVAEALRLLQVTYNGIAPATPTEELVRERLQGRKIEFPPAASFSEAQLKTISSAVATAVVAALPAGSKAPTAAEVATAVVAEFKKAGN
jgi:murein DD-endopeptidase MepM/ murein hydrolase activator NlpD